MEASQTSGKRFWCVSCRDGHEVYVSPAVGEKWSEADAIAAGAKILHARYGRK